MELEWYYNLGWQEYIWIGVFTVASMLYMGRYIRLAQLLRQNSWRIIFKFMLRIIYFTLLLLAWRGPSFGYGKKFVQTLGKDIYVVLDLSQSMLATDISPSRIEKAKYELKNVFKSLNNDRLGLVVFSAEPFLQCPLTADKSALDLYLSTAHPRLMPDGSTDVGMALDLALKKHTQYFEGNPGTKAQVVILVTDGEDFGNETMKVLDSYRQQGIKLLIVGIGSAQGSRIPVYGGYKYTANGQVVISKLDYSKLQQMVEQTDGQFFEISPQKNEVANLIQALNNIKGQHMDIRATDVSHNKYEYLLWIALLLMAMDVVLIVKVIKL
jgi:Ca-activated chloride channel family protein